MSAHSASSPALDWAGLGVAVVVAAIGAGLGFWQVLPAQQVIVYTAATLALVLWAWTHFIARRRAAAAAPRDEGGPSGRAVFRAWLKKHRAILITLGLIAAVYIGVAFAVTAFLTWGSLLAVVLLMVLLVLSVQVSRLFADNRSAFIGLTVLVALFALGSGTVDGFSSTTNLKSMLVFAAFLGLACVGQTLVALLGGLDLSIPFVIGASNVGLLYLIGLGVPSWMAVIIIILLGAAIGFVNGILSFRLQGQALILTLGVGFAVSGAIQIITSIGTAFAGNVFGTVPDWLRNLAAMNGRTFGLNLPPVILIWAVVAIVLIWGLKNTTYGRQLYALGGNRTSASRVLISERRYWVGVYMISGAISALTGSLLLGWSGGGFIGVGQPYLFMTLAAVVIGGTSLLGGNGGYGFTVIGVCVLQVLTSFLVGIGLKYEWQQFIFGILILPMVALYARSPHIRTQI
ncbi:MAG TPA: ABC transporter permease [Burkholderiaceae bacterium]|nr:ABC transporter permease [Burkholderiaceae bacterium]